MTTNNINKEVTKRIVEFCEEITSCDCCGKSDLKGTYLVLLNDSPNYYGSVCAFKIQGVTYEEQKEVKKEYKKRLKASEKLEIMEKELVKTKYNLDKMYKFIESKNLDLKSFILKYGKIIEDAELYIAYEIGNKVKIFDK